MCSRSTSVQSFTYTSCGSLNVLVKYELIRVLEKFKTMCMSYVYAVYMKTPEVDIKIDYGQCTRPKSLL